jgi:Fic family protein
LDLIWNLAPPLGELIHEAEPDVLMGALTRAITPAGNPRLLDEYLHWNKLRHLDPPDGLSSREWWVRIKLARAGDMRHLPLTDPDGREFSYCLPDLVLRHLHRIDQRCGGEVAMDEVVTSEHQAGRGFLVNSLMEEAIRSSQLEGAATSRQVGQEMLRSGREPRDRGERMIANNYRALHFMREEMGDALTPEAILELHRIVTEGTLVDPAIHRPRPAEQLPERIRLLCEFANEGEDGDRFIPPVVRAILVHFWLAYDHPFEDGNGRTARILFFWMMRARGYWLAEYLPISRLIRNGPAKYARAFLETESDEGDTTYFLLDQLELMERAIEDLHLYLQRKSAEQHDVEEMLGLAEGLNGRQLALLTHAAKHPDHTYTFGGHARSNRVTHETARADLGTLADRGLLVRGRRGRTYLFETPADLAERLKESGA